MVYVFQLLYTNTKSKIKEFFKNTGNIKKRGTFFVRCMVKLGKKENFMRLFPQDDRTDLRDPEEEGTDVVIKEDPYLKVELIHAIHQRFLQWNNLDD